MSIYMILVFLHVAGALALFASIGVEQVALHRLRGARTGAQVNEWLAALAGLRRIDAPAGVTLLATGIYFVVTRWGHQAWAGLAVIGMIVMALLGILVNGRRLRAIAWEASGAFGPVSMELGERLHDPVLLTSSMVRAAIGVGIVFNMVMKPPIVESAAVLIVATIVGVLGAQIVQLPARSNRMAPRRAQRQSA